MTHEDKQKALEVAQRFIDMEYEIRYLRAVLNAYWRRDDPFEAFVQKGIQQLQSREKEDRGPQYLESTFHATSDDAALLHNLHQQTIGRVQIP